METLVTKNWQDYSLIDTGDKLRLERFGAFFVVRPDPSALWKATTPSHKGWRDPDARFTGEKGQPWSAKKEFPQAGWEIAWKDVRFLVKPTAFRHMGVFPEQAIHWEWIDQSVRAFIKEQGRAPKVLNLFGYTGIASLVAAKAGAEVCHVDASKGTVQWASENAARNKLSVRWIVDDALKFMHREVRRGSYYDFIFMDPPVFGRGPQGEIWRIEEFLAELARTAGELLENEKGKLLLNFYATDLYPEAVARTVRQSLGKNIRLDLSTLCLEEEKGNLLQTGYSLRSH